LFEIGPSSCVGVEVLANRVGAGGAAGAEELPPPVAGGVEVAGAPATALRNRLPDSSFIDLACTSGVIFHAV